MNIAMLRNGKEAKRFPNMVVRQDGTIWMHNTMPVMDGQSATSKEIGMDNLKALVKAQEWDKIPHGCFAKFGKNDSGLLVVDADTYYAELRAAKEAALTPAQRERREIETIRYRADRRIDDEDEMNVQDHFTGRAKAAAMLKAWREKYPAEARAEDAADLRAQAEAKRSLAVGALTYDADGWISQDEQRKRHDEIMAEAVALEKQAKELEAK